MKSQMSQLQGRGFLSQKDLDAFSHLSTTELIGELESDDAVKRTVAIRLLAPSASSDDSMNLLFVERLRRETKLYTKLELCGAIQNGGVGTARMLVPLLGTIGKNQHRRPEPGVFRKTSYPLPRDIVARILARMDTQILPMLVSVIRDGPRIQVVEAIDAVGFMCFYSSVPGKDRMAALRALISCLKGSPDDDLLQWKIVRAFESFNHPDCLTILAEIVAESAIPEVRQEARRSLTLVAKQLPM
ncbi:hypothetical protein [Arthrobacter sp. GMC3]|uniref:hypothetical protein n=1 Tax=Arthrobacter sp. GMC3 TaxID=2058894 RepID=UPI0015E48515|nr:hypothetical protein [Arthrobacter sp. GMC3]